MYFTLFWLSFMSKVVPNFSNFLHILKIVLGLLRTPLVGHSECIQGKKTKVEHFYFIGNLKTCISHCFG